jgi:hypothetical protein
MNKPIYHGTPYYYKLLPMTEEEKALMRSLREQEHDHSRTAVAGDLGVSEDMYRDPWAEED